MRVELAAEIRGRPCAVMAWFDPADHAVGIMRPSFKGAMAIDADGVVYDDLTSKELEPVLPRLVSQAEQLQEG